MTAILVTAALLADGLTANPSSEYNPIAAPILAAGLGLAVKAAEIVLVLAVVAIVRRTRPGVAQFVAVVAVGAGLLGAASNVG